MSHILLFCNISIAPSAACARVVRSKGLWHHLLVCIPGGDSLPEKVMHCNYCRAGCEHVLSLIVQRKSAVEVVSELWEAVLGAVHESAWALEAR